MLGKKTENDAATLTKAAASALVSAVFHALAIAAQRKNK